MGDSEDGVDIDREIWQWTDTVTQVCVTISYSNHTIRRSRSQMLVAADPPRVAESSDNLSMYMVGVVRWIDGSHARPPSVDMMRLIQVVVIDWLINWLKDEEGLIGPWLGHQSTPFHKKDF